MGVKVCYKMEGNLKERRNEGVDAIDVIQSVQMKETNEMQRAWHKKAGRGVGKSWVRRQRACTIAGFTRTKGVSPDHLRTSTSWCNRWLGIIVLREEGLMLVQFISRRKEGINDR